MSRWDDAWLDVIDERVKASQKQITATGTIASRSTDTTATVVMDGDSLAVPCKVFENVWVRPGDRVGLQLFGSDWVVVGSFNSEIFTYKFSVNSAAVIATATGARVSAATLDNVNFAAGRAYRFTLRGWLDASVGAVDEAELSLRRDTISGQELVTILTSLPAGGKDVAVYSEQIRRRTGDDFVDGVMEVALGGGSVANPVRLVSGFTPMALSVTVEDVGPNGNYTGFASF